MRHIIFLSYLIAFVLIMPGCKKNEVKDPSFTVTTDKTTYKVGEAIQFNLSGNPNMITFYSGEMGARYDFFNRGVANGTPKLQFNSLAANGIQANSLKVMVSSNFAGAGADEAATAANIMAATWTEISSRATLSSGAATPSGVIDLKDIAAEGKPIYIAFKYVGQAGSIQRKWTISGLTVTNTLEDGTIYTLANHTNAVINNYGVSSTFSPGWVGAKVSNTFGWVVSASSLVITGATSVAASTAASEAWVFSGPIDLNRVTPDLGRVIKNITARLDFFPYSYIKPGTYEATFEGNNATAFDGKKVVRKVELTIVN